MPIDGLSGIVRIPRLGKIHLGIKAFSERAQAEYPKATDYFVVPQEVAAVYGEKPTELDILFPVEDPEQFAQQWLRAYSMTQGLVCIGNGITARAKIDVDTGALASHETKTWQWQDELVCNPQECPEYESKRCRRVMNLQFLLPKVPGLGVYQIDTSSFYSIVNINSMIAMLKGLFQRCSMIPLTLALGPIEVTPQGLKKKTVYIMHIKKDVKLAELAQLALLPPARVLVPEPDTAEPPGDLYPEGILLGKEEQTTSPSEAGEGEPLITPPPEGGHDESPPWGEEPPWEAEIFPDEPPLEGQPEVTLIDPELLKGWEIVKSTLKELKLTDSQIAKWWNRYDLVLTRADFEGDVPPAHITNDMLSSFQTSLDSYKTKSGKQIK